MSPPLYHGCPSFLSNSSAPTQVTPTMRIGSYLLALHHLGGIVLAGIVWSSIGIGQETPYDHPPEIHPPLYRVRYEKSEIEGGLQFASNFTIWIPEGVKRLRGVVVHQHGCGEGSCKSGQTGVMDLHWQALAKKHDCALLSPVYEQPESADCKLWCDPRNGSDATFQKALLDLGATTGHPELGSIPWALWGHSGGGHWAGGMAILHPDRVVAAWLRSGVPPIRSEGDKPAPWELHDGVTTVPIMCNLGTKEGVTDKEGRFARVWGGVESFFVALRTRGGLASLSIDPKTSHECGNQRYLAIAWLDACLEHRLPREEGAPMQVMPGDQAWVALFEPSNPTRVEAMPAASFSGEMKTTNWLPNEDVASQWMQYMIDTSIEDKSPPPTPRNVKVTGGQIEWECDADLESGLAQFVIIRDGKAIARVPEMPTNPFGRPLFQGSSYSDTPVQPLAMMRFVDASALLGEEYRYQVVAINTAGLRSPRSEVGSEVGK